MIGVLTDEPPATEQVPHDPFDIFDVEAAVLQPAIFAMAQEFPNLTTIAATLRRVHTAGSNDWGGLCWHQGELYRSRNYAELDILDRIGGGDGFVSGLIYGLMVEGDPQKAVDYGAAHGALAMTTPGDTSMATLAEVQKLAAGGDARVQR